ncbi:MULTISPECIES: hypothetical protein [Bacillus amyloliquefaciens group]|uniref:hypothetical protein n=1 Tax=Bacillus amyloliquefaciens group TaxID=1938374 RepID=UPI0021506AD2|nr:MULTISPECIES: hypothetical protein [Bacillus amyloliquefaciens group]MCR4368195.1 hypothetical protein [Bacillus amyloliquefaciens]MCV3201745.1 hypothetical protein [Bacillus velezensis]
MKMKKIIIASILLLTGVFGFNLNASAAWSGWQKESLGHTARVYTDASNYSSSATTVDWKIEKKGSSTLYYTAGVYKKRSGGGYTDTNLVQRGSFKTVTPMKSFNVQSIRNKTGKGSYVIQVDCYTDSSKNHYVGTFQSAAFNIK